MTPYGKMVPQEAGVRYIIASGQQECMQCSEIIGISHFVGPAFDGICDFLHTDGKVNEKMCRAQVRLGLWCWCWWCLWCWWWGRWWCQWTAPSFTTHTAGPQSSLSLRPVAVPLAWPEWQAHVLQSCPEFVNDWCYQDYGGSQVLRSPCPPYLICHYCLGLNPLHCRRGYGETSAPL